MSKRPDKNALQLFHCEVNDALFLTDNHIFFAAAGGWCGELPEDLAWFYAKLIDHSAVITEMPGLSDLLAALRAVHPGVVIDGHRVGYSYHEIAISILDDARDGIQRIIDWDESWPGPTPKFKSHQFKEHEKDIRWFCRRFDYASNGLAGLMLAEWDRAEHGKSLAPPQKLANRRGRPRSKDVANRRQKVMELTKAGLKRGDIADRLGVYPATVSDDLRHLRKAGKLE